MAKKIRQLIPYLQVLKLCITFICISFGMNKRCCCGCCWYRKTLVVTLYPKKIEDSLLNSGQALETLTHWNKNDVRRKRLGPKDYIEHEKQILEKTLSEIFQDFKRKYKETAMKQTLFCCACLGSR